MRLAVPAAGAVAVGLLPAVTSWGPTRSLLTPEVLPPAYSGIGDLCHVALTFDDGPDPASTPAFLHLLEQAGVTATFFLLGRHAADHPSLVRDLASAGHEIGVHGWDHRAVVAKGPRTLRRDLARTRDLLEDETGRAIRWYRPPYGVVTAWSLWAARSCGLRTVLWSAWGRDWERRATPRSVRACVQRDLGPGGTVLLHDTDRTSAPGSWRTTLPATGLLLEDWSGRGLRVGPLAEHWSASRPGAARVGRDGPEPSGAWQVAAPSLRP